MRILIHGINYHPELTGIGKYTGEMAEWLASQGHEVRVVTAPPYYPEWRVGEGYSARRYRRETLNGVSLYRCPIWVPTHPSGLKRILHLLSFAVASLPVMLSQVRWRPHLVMAIEPPLFCAPQAFLTAVLARATSWLHIQDFEVDAAFELGILPSRTLQKLVAACEAGLMRRFDRVSTISRAMMDRLEAKGVSRERSVRFPNWVDVSHIYPTTEGVEMLRQELGIPTGTAVALYSGNLGEKQGLDILIEAARRLQHHPDLCILICGDGAAKPRLQAAAQDLQNVRFIPLQPSDRLNALLNMAAIHLLPQRADAADLVMPSKLVGILACGGAVIATAFPESELAHVVTEAGGIATPPGDVEALTAQIVSLLADGEARRRIGEGARRYAQRRLSKEDLLREFLGQVEHARDGGAIPSVIG